MVYSTGGKAFFTLKDVILNSTGVSSQGIESTAVPELQIFISPLWVLTDLRRPLAYNLLIYSRCKDYMHYLIPLPRGPRKTLSKYANHRSIISNYGNKKYGIIHTVSENEYHTFGT